MIAIPNKENDMGVKIKKPKCGHYFHYCYECRWFEYQGQIGAYQYGMCKAIDSDERDVYSPPCGLFERRADEHTD